MYYLSIVSLTNDACLFWHKWDAVKATPVTKYELCRKCRSKRIEQMSEGYQPIDFDFIQDQKKGV